MRYLIIVGSTVACYLIIMVIIKLFGKKELTKLTVYDLVFLLLISNVAQNMMTEPERLLKK